MSEPEVNCNPEEDAEVAPPPQLLESNTPPMRAPGLPAVRTGSTGLREDGLLPEGSVESLLGNGEDAREEPASRRLTTVGIIEEDMAEERGKGEERKCRREITR